MSIFNKDMVNEENKSMTSRISSGSSDGGGSGVCYNDGITISMKRKNGGSSNSSSNGMKLRSNKIIGRSGSSSSSLPLSLSSSRIAAKLESEENRETHSEQQPTLGQEESKNKINNNNTKSNNDENGNVIRVQPYINYHNQQSHQSNHRPNKNEKSTIGDENTSTKLFTLSNIYKSHTLNNNNYHHHRNQNLEDRNSNIKSSSSSSKSSILISIKQHSNELNLSTNSNPILKPTEQNHSSVIITKQNENHHHYQQRQQQTKIRSSPSIRILRRSRIPSSSTITSNSTRPLPQEQQQKPTTKSEPELKRDEGQQHQLKELESELKRERKPEVSEQEEIIKPKRRRLKRPIWDRPKPPESEQPIEINKQQLSVVDGNHMTTCHHQTKTGDDERKSIQSQTTTTTFSSPEKIKREDSSSTEIVRIVDSDDHNERANIFNLKLKSQQKYDETPSGYLCSPSPMNICSSPYSDSGYINGGEDESTNHLNHNNNVDDENIEIIDLTTTNSNSNLSSTLPSLTTASTTMMIARATTTSIKYTTNGNLPPQQPATYDPSGYGVVEDQPELTEQIREQDDEPNKIFVGGLPWDTTEYDLEYYFSHFGKVTEINIKYDPLSCLTRGFCFVTFQSEETVKTILKKPVHIIKGKIIELKRAKYRPICKKVFVGGLDPLITETDLKSYFSQYGTVIAIEAPKDRLRNRKREFCFIVFDTEMAADRACYYPRQYIINRICDVKKAQPQPICYQQKRMAATAGLEISTAHLTKILLGDGGRTTATSAITDNNSPEVSIPTGVTPEPINSVIAPMGTILYYQAIPPSRVAGSSTNLTSRVIPVPAQPTAATTAVIQYPTAYQIPTATPATLASDVYVPAAVYSAITANGFTFTNANGTHQTNALISSCTGAQAPEPISVADYYLNYYAQTAAYYAQQQQQQQQQQLQLSSTSTTTTISTISDDSKTNNTKKSATSNPIIGEPTFNHQSYHVVHSACKSTNDSDGLSKSKT